jgi:hypothetical protein
MTVVNLSRLHDDTIVSGEDALASDIDGELDQIVNIHQNISHPDVVSMFRNATAYSNGQLDINTAAKDIAIGDTVNMFGLSTFDIQPHLAAGLAQYDCVYHSGVAVDSDTIYVRKADNTDVDSGKKYLGLMMQALTYGQRGACRFAGLRGASPHLCRYISGQPGQ